MFITRDKSTVSGDTTALRQRTLTFLALFQPIGNAFKTITRVMKTKGVKRILVLSTTAFGLPGETVSASGR